MKRWKEQLGCCFSIFKFSTTVRKVIYTTNAIESLNSTYRKLNRRKRISNDTALLKALYLATFEATKNGLPPSVIGLRFMENWALCTKGLARVSKRRFKKTGETVSSFV